MSTQRMSSVPVAETVIRNETHRPMDAYPEYPVHLEKVYYTRDPVTNALHKTGRRDWVGSFATEELAQGHVLKRAAGL